MLELELKLERDAELMFRQQYGKEKEAKRKKLWEHTDNMRSPWTQGTRPNGRPGDITMVEPLGEITASFRRERQQN